jgi:hypothetical protein
LSIEKAESCTLAKKRSVVLIGADVDPRLPGMRQRPSWDPWDPNDLIPNLETALGPDLPIVTWLIRADDTIRHVTGSFESGYTTKRAMWDRLQSHGHELGWHFHHWTYGDQADGFDPNPAWLTAAHGALSRFFHVSSTRTGWDYGNNETMRRLEALGIGLDFSAIPGHLVWWTIDGERIVVDWRRAPRVPYHPSARDYERPGSASLQLLEVPIASFRASAISMAKRAVWRTLHGVWSFKGLGATTRFLTQPWPSLPPSTDVLAFFFHPEDLSADGIANFARNVALLRERFDPEFVTGRELASRLANQLVPSVR